MRTKAEILEEIKTLKKMKPTVRRFSVFRDDHHAAIDAQIEVLENSMCSEAIYEKWDEANPDFSQAIYDAAMDAHDWRGEADSDAPSKSWEDLVS